MRLLGASFKKTEEKPTANAYATELKRLDSGVKRTIGLFMHGFRMIGFRRKEALFVLYPRDLPEQLTETLDVLVEQGHDRLRGIVASGKTSAAGDQHHLH